MLDLIEGFTATGDPRWQPRIGTMIELLQDDALQALQNEKGQLVEEYRR